MEAGREALLARQTINDILGQVALETSLSVYDFSVDTTDRYLYLPESAGQRRLVLFHATKEAAGNLALHSQEERHERGWRKCAAGAGLYGGNTPFAASASVVDSEGQRQIHMYATSPVASRDIAAPMGEGYLAKMIRAQFDRRFAEQQSRQRTEASKPIELLEPGLVSAILRDTYISMPHTQVLKPRWIKVSAEPEEAGTQTLEYLGTLHEQPAVHKTLGKRVRFWTSGHANW